MKEYLLSDGNNLVIMSSFKVLVADGANFQVTLCHFPFCQDDNYLEASSITVGYSFSTKPGLGAKMNLSTPRLFITQNNLFRFATIKTERGTGYPFSRSFSFGLSTTF